jgi:hypothetical protein
MSRCKLNIAQWNAGVERRHDEPSAKHVRVDQPESGALADRPHPTMCSAAIEPLTVLPQQNRTVAPLADCEIDRAESLLEVGRNATQRDTAMASQSITARRAQPAVGDARWPPCVDAFWDTRGTRSAACNSYISLVEWKQLDFPTRAGLVATVMAVLGALIPPISVMSALVAIAFSGTAVQRARRRRQSNPVARLCLVVSVAVVALIIVGSAIFSAGN